MPPRPRPLLPHPRALLQARPPQAMPLQAPGGLRKPCTPCGTGSCAPPCVHHDARQTHQCAPRYQAPAQGSLGQRSTSTFCQPSMGAGGGAAAASGAASPLAGASAAAGSAAACCAAASSATGAAASLAEALEASAAAGGCAAAAGAAPPPSGCLGPGRGPRSSLLEGLLLRASLLSLPSLHSTVASCQAWRTLAGGWELCSTCERRTGHSNTGVAM